jgi:hypothetical protein
MKKLCVDQGRGTGTCKGVWVLFERPCDWKDLAIDTPDIANSLYYEINDTTYLMFFLSISKFPVDITDEQFKQMILTDKGLRGLVSDVTQGGGVFLSGRGVKIDGRDWAEIIYKSPKSTVSEYDIYNYMVNYVMIQNGIIIKLIYMAGASQEKTADDLFKKYKELFVALAAKVNVDIK